MTTRTRRDEVPWRDWLPVSLALPTPAGSNHAVGLYQGGFMRQRGWYRPSEVCLMRDQSQPFCAVCREALILRLSKHARPFELEVRRVDRDTVHLQVRTWIPGGGGARWSRNGGFLEVDGGEFVVRRSETPNGDNELELLVGDTTEWVRSDPNEWSFWRVKFSISKGYLWDKGVKVQGPYHVEKRELGGEDLFRKLDRG